MKLRILSSFVGIVLLTLILMQHRTLILNLAVSVLGALMCYEIFCVVKVKKKNSVLVGVSLVFSVLFPFSKINEVVNFKIALTVLYFVTVTLILFKIYSDVRIEKIAFCCGLTVLIQLCLNSVLILKDKLSPYDLYHIILMFVIAWSCDTGAFFTGLKFGKIKLAPIISPKKTVEGVIGGAVISVVGVIIYNCIYLTWFFKGTKFNVAALMLVTVLGIFGAVVGDLLGSLIKRQFETKDFGFIFLGHGGILDRFDSWIYSIFIVFPVLITFPIVS